MAGPLVLLVDDDPEICQFLAMLLDLEGFTTRTATRAEDALELVRTELPAAVLLDVAMPGVDGFEVCRRLRATGLDSAILLVSARPGPELAARAAAAGADDFLRKPFDNVELVSRVRHWIEVREGRAPSRPVR